MQKFDSISKTKRNFQPTLVQPKIKVKKAKIKKTKKKIKINLIDTCEEILQTGVQRGRWTYLTDSVIGPFWVYALGLNLIICAYQESFCYIN